MPLDPAVTGRSVVVGPGEAAPPPWNECPRVVVDAITPVLADELSAAWRERRPMVIELHPGLGLDDPSAPPPEAITGRQPWELDVELDLIGERLHHAVWANTDRWAATAVALGATAGGPLDVVLPDGTPALCDGGPLDADARWSAGQRRRGGAPHRSRARLAAPARSQRHRRRARPRSAGRGHPPRWRRRGSSPRPDRARPACSPSGPAPCCGPGACRPPRSPSSPSTGAPPTSCAPAPPTSRTAHPHAQRPRAATAARRRAHHRRAAGARPPRRAGRPAPPGRDRSRRRRGSTRSGGCGSGSGRRSRSRPSSTT